MEATRARYEARFGKERADRITQTYRNLLIFPNLIIIDSTAITVRTFYPRSPDFLDITAWNIAPVDESASDRALRLDNFLTFFGPGGFATPDDVEMLESCQRGFAAQGHGWSDISRGMKSDPRPGDEFQIRTFWRRWNELMASPSPVSPSPEIRLRDEA
jgi:p-cumate 2,3-dioxygenase alpha subunit